MAHPDDPVCMHDEYGRAWETRRAKYGDRGHNGAYIRPASALGRRALALVMRLHDEGTLSEGQCCKALDLDRVEFRIMRDAILGEPTPPCEGNAG